MINQLKTKFRFNRAVFHGSTGRSFEAVLSVLKEQQTKINELVVTVNKQQGIIKEYESKKESNEKV